MNKDEQIDYFMQFITTEMNNSLKLVKNIKNLENIKDVKLEVCQYALQFAENLKDLGIAIQKGEKNGKSKY